LIKVKGPKGEVSKKLAGPGVEIKAENNSVSIISKKATKREKKIIYAIRSHIKNMIKGVTEGFVYKLKICPGHFPMNVSVEKEYFTVKNLFGEKTPRKLKIGPEVKIKIDGKDVYVEGINKELTSQTAASIEKLTKVKGRDRRIFQDGIYIVSKDGKEIK
ncbi:MAG: 50S ribosomal protein L6, partial [Candidatus Nanoarchaeia archaeon]|nr:50S ribosomal protein L6 [Candidatus Nanoarchaeia archaeon]